MLMYTYLLFISSSDLIFERNFELATLIVNITKLIVVHKKEKLAMHGGTHI